MTRAVVLALLFCHIGFDANAAEPAPPAAKRPNILLIYSDDQRHDTIHALGNAEIKTPNLDRLVARGHAFTNNYVMGGMHGAICVPSRAMLHTGRSLWHVPDNLQGATTLAETLGKAGYATYATGKWHNTPASFRRSLQHGKNIFFGGMSNQFKVTVQDLLDDGTLSEKRTGDKYSTTLFTDTAIDYLRAHRGAQPFFLYVAFTSPHDPRTAPEAFATMYDPDKIALPKNFLPQHPFDNGELRVRDELLAPHPRTPEVVRRHIADYYAMISHVDHEVGRLLAALTAAGHADDTLVLFAGDNGLAVGQHGLFGKQNLYEHSAKMPLVVAGPGVAHGTSDALVYHFDMFATMCEAAQAAPPAETESKSLWPLLRGEQKGHRDFILGAYRNVQRALRVANYKLIEYHVADVKTTQLFDLDKDPWEIDNLADKPAHAATLARLRARLKAARAEYGDPVDFDAVGGKASKP